MKISPFPIGLKEVGRMGIMLLCTTAFHPSSLRAGEAVAAATPAPAVEEQPFTNWIDLSLGGVFSNGDAAQFQQRHGINADAFGGLEDFHYEKEVGKRGSLKVDGHAIFGNQDYAGRVLLSFPDVGYIDIGYHQFRT